MNKPPLVCGFVLACTTCNVDGEQDEFPFNVHQASRYVYPPETLRSALTELPPRLYRIYAAVKTDLGILLLGSYVIRPHEKDNLTKCKSWLAEMLSPAKMPNFPFPDAHRVIAHRITIAAIHNEMGVSGMDMGCNLSQDRFDIAVNFLCNIAEAVARCGGHICWE